MRLHNPQYQPPVTSDSRVTGCTNFVNYQKPDNFNGHNFFAYQSFSDFSF